MQFIAVKEDDGPTFSLKKVVQSLGERRLAAARQTKEPKHSLHALRCRWSWGLTTFGMA